MEKPDKHFDFKLYLEAATRHIMIYYGNSEQARILVGTYAIISVLRSEELPGIISKRTLYRHLEMMSAAGVRFNESYRKEIIRAYS